MGVTIYYLKNEFINWAGFLHANSNAISFGYTDIVLYIFDFKCQSTAVVLVGPPRR